MVKFVRCAGIALMLGAALAAGACGKSEAEKKAEESRAALEKAAKDLEAAGKKVGEGTAADAAKGIEQFAKGLESMAGAMAGNGGKTVEPVHFRELQGMFVPLDGWEMGKPTGEKLSTPFAYSQAKVEYRKDNQEIEVSVTDSGFNQLMLAPFSLFLTSGYEKETEHGYERSAKVAGYPGWEEWNSSNKRGEVNAVVNKRFLVKFEGSGLDDIKVLHQLADASNLTKLASLK